MKLKQTKTIDTKKKKEENEKTTKCYTNIYTFTL